ncbi:MAG: MarR family transcriptional regulator [Lachnospiraceae bacterium]|nr:MarR family transcriptional regulator [Lachnospiraceae bacterium]
MMPAPFLIGLLSAFENRFQAVADSFFEEITWKQFFAIICINLCRESPTINELSEVMGSSHQNVKQILLKLEKKGFVEMIVDEKDRRKQRIVTTKKCEDFCQRNDQGSKIQMNKIFEGISQEQLVTTIQTISQMERNLKK